MNAGRQANRSAARPTFPVPVFVRRSRAAGDVITPIAGSIRDPWPRHTGTWSDVISRDQSRVGEWTPLKIGTEGGDESKVALPVSEIAPATPLERNSREGLTRRVVRLLQNRRC